MQLEAWCGCDVVKKIFTPSARRMSGKRKDADLGEIRAFRF